MMFGVPLNMTMLKKMIIVTRGGSQSHLPLRRERSCWCLIPLAHTSAGGTVASGAGVGKKDTSATVAGSTATGGETD